MSNSIGELLARRETIMKWFRLLPTSIRYFNSIFTFPWHSTTMYKFHFHDYIYRMNNHACIIFTFQFFQVSIVFTNSQKYSQREKMFFNEKIANGEVTDLMSRTAQNCRKYSARSVVTCKSSFTHSGSVINHDSCEVFFRIHRHLVVRSGCSWSLWVRWSWWDFECPVTIGPRLI